MWEIASSYQKSNLAIDASKAILHEVGDPCKTFFDGGLIFSRA